MRVCISGGEACFDWPACSTPLSCRKPAVPAGAVCFTPLRRNSVLPPPKKIAHLLNEFPSVFALATLSLRPGTPPFNWSASWPLLSTSSFCSHTNPRCSLEGCKVVRPLSAGQEGQAVCLSAEVCLCARDLIYWCQ